MIGDLEWYKKRDRWDMKFMHVADNIATWSKDPSTKVGAVIVGPENDIRATGYNGFPRECDDDPAIYNNRPRKLLRIELE